MNLKRIHGIGEEAQLIVRYMRGGNLSQKERQQIEIWRLTRPGVAKIIDNPQEIFDDVEKMRQRFNSAQWKKDKKEGLLRMKEFVRQNGGNPLERRVNKKKLFLFLLILVIAFALICQLVVPLILSFK